ncbi:adenosylcobinamide-phosphate synthase CbiB [Methylosinus sporium]|uniref:Cobalamin biosynthesis protein CobD n=1 Tax=Methylosinus sporium TaxID=428 RepID=A0A2U1SVX1_METSR|nr:adenosylcobinamide-phosphate synthase CbiB [Methylosinus sporium]PWB95767.1 cobalamin biosynthesis protein CobD [Methylosinus sporium]
MLAALADNLALAALGLSIEAAIGYPPRLFAAIGHPVTWIGALIAALDRSLNHDGAPPLLRRLAGVVAILAVVAIAFAIGWLLQAACLALPFGIVPLAVLTSSLYAQRSLYSHVKEVADELDHSLERGRASVGKIVGRDVARLDEAGVSRAAIESLAENFSDGVIGPALATILFGLPGALIYKASNTADSMIGHRTMRHEAFGWASARLDDLLNLPAARLSAALVATGAAMTGASPRAAVSTCLRDSRAHASPNAGWPEAAMAGALDLRLGGPRAYGAHEVQGAWLGSGRTAATPTDIRRALRIFRCAAATAICAFAGAALTMLSN